MKELLKEARYLRITGFSKMKKDELEKAIRDCNTKETSTSDVVCEKCLCEQYKQRLIDEHFYSKKLLEDAIRKLSLLCEYCSSDCINFEGDIEVCGNCGTVKPDVAEYTRR